MLLFVRVKDKSAKILAARIFADRQSISIATHLGGSQKNESIQLLIDMKPCRATRSRF
jgi:hypothetical protein